MLSKSIPERSAPQLGMGRLKKWARALSRNLSIHSGSFLWAEMAVTTSGERPFSVRKTETSSSWKPYL